MTVSAVRLDEFVILAARTDHKQVRDEVMPRKSLSRPVTLGRPEDLIGVIEKQLTHTSDTKALFTIRWSIP